MNLLRLKKTEPECKEKSKYSSISLWLKSQFLPFCFLYRNSEMHMVV